MINIKHIDVLKIIAEIEASIIPGGSMFLFIEGRTIKWKVASKTFDMDIFKEGNEVLETDSAVKSMKAGKLISENVPREKYGKRLSIVAIPIVDDENKAIGAFSIVFPRLHPVVAGFSSFAPVIVEMFSEGAYIYMSDLTKIIRVQSSQKFTLPNIHLGYELKETDMAYRTIHSGKAQTMEIGEERYGVPVYIVNYPLYDEDTGKEIVATIGVVTPKGASNKLKYMSENLSNNLAGIASTIEQLAAGAAKIHSNEQNLYSHIGSISGNLDKINGISEFITSVANQSNMLGLNAAIEAARAGEMGRGFSVVSGEIRKLSNQSKETVPQIKVITEDIKNKIAEVNNESRESLVTSEEQAAATQEISASVEELLAMTKELNGLAKDL